jgi:RNA polymerase sigma-70 factor (ECF subfamily)
VLDEPPPEPTPEELLMAAQTPIPDERLRLIFVCCHPAIAPEARAALTLQVVGGLTAAEIAAIFLLPEAPEAQRLVRAKRKIKAAGVPFEVPGRDGWPERLEAVLATLEIAYARAYADAALAGDGAEFGLEVVRLSGVLAELLPWEPEVLALAALVRFAEARRPARLDGLGAMVPLSEQDVRLWDRDVIATGETLLRRAGRLPGAGPYQLMAAVHAAHVSRARSGVTPWAAILALYDALLAFRPGAVTQVNRAVAMAEVQGAEAGLAALAAAGASRPLDGWLPYQVARAALLAEAGRPREAAAALEAALALGPGPAERRYLERRRPQLDNAGAPA